MCQYAVLFCIWGQGTGNLYFYETSVTTSRNRIHHESHILDYFATKKSYM